MTAVAVTAPKKVGGNRQLRRWGVSVGSVLCALGAWFLATEVLELATPLVLPSPVAVAESFVSYLGEPFQGSTLIEHAWVSLQTVLGGWLLAAAIGLPLGALMGWSKIADKLVGPIFHLVRPVPPIAWIPLVIVWFGIGDFSRMLVVFIAAAIPCVVNAREGVLQVDPKLLRAARMLGASRARTLFSVVLPASAPMMFAGLRISLGNAWMTLVGAELVAASAGLGFVLLGGRRLLQSDLVFVAMVTIALLGALLGFLLRKLEPRLIPWEASRGRR
jgi:taurine transport system permease protein